VSSRGADHCITCADEGVPMRVVSAEPERELALCEREDGERQTVDTGLVGPLSSGDAVLVHAGTALTVLGGAA
jgi:hydrogenase assembly chaperone HypC/HupF